MVLIPVDSVREGMVLARSLFNDNNELLLAAGFKIKYGIIKSLKKLSIGTVWIHEDGTEDVVPEEVIDEQVGRQAMAAVMDTTETIGESIKIREETMDGIEKSMKETQRFKNMVAVPQVQKAVSDMLDDLISRPGVALNLSTIRSQKSYLYQHSVDVTVISMMIANKLRFNKEEVQELGMGCLLHDIGMTVIPKKISNKPGRLTFQEYSLLKEHPTYGYQILNENQGVSAVAAHVAFQHHERQDGCGYPRKLKGNNLLPIKTLNPEKGYMYRFAEIAAVADAYDAMHSPRPHVPSRTPEEIIKHLIIASGTQLNRPIVDTLISLIPVFPVGSYVRIVEAKSDNHNGCVGVVAGSRKSSLDRPMIILLKNANGAKINPVKIDLIQYPDIKIQFVPLKELSSIKVY